MNQQTNYANTLAGAKSDYGKLNNHSTSEWILKFKWCFFKFFVWQRNVKYQKWEKWHATQVKDNSTFFILVCVELIGKFYNMGM